MKFSVRQTVFLVFLLFTVLPSLQTGAAKEAGSNDNREGFAIIRIRHRPAAELVDQARTLLGPSSRVSVDRVGNSLIVAADPAGIARLRRELVRLDVRVPRITITLRGRQTAEQGRSLSTSGIHAGEPALRLSTGHADRATRMRLTLNSGSEGYLNMARDLPLTETWITLCGRYGYRFSWIRTSQRLDTGFSVRATALPDDRVELVLTPRLDFDNGHQLVFVRAASRLTVDSSRWTTLAANDTRLDETAGLILSRGGSNERAMVLEVRAEVTRSR